MLGGRKSVVECVTETNIVEWLKARNREGALISKDGLLYSVQYSCKEHNLETPFTEGRSGKSQNLYST